MKMLAPALTLSLLLAGCGGSPEQPVAGADNAATTVPAASSNAATSMGGDVAALPTPVPASAPASPIPSEPRACSAEIGAAEAKALVDQCRAVSPATRPPCNAANSCAMIRSEIIRSCALFGDDRPRECGSPGEAEQAADTVRLYYDAINARDYPVAYAQWGGEGQASGKSYADFARGFADTVSVKVSAREQAVEGAAGSLYATVPVTVDATLADGRRQRFTGSYVVRRVNDIDGSTAEQRRWHLQSAKLKAG
ncbi:hypothetical protein [uncultured Sphingomonas sp.]|uniref:hypothetical protein n=1 Tax=uncultured Sphingomonas sp. TaxID=158754 RepID=UPI0025FE3068|nr:hypothetical protein [uncultured Sphingomonas sp.]